MPISEAHEGKRPTDASSYAAFSSQHDGVQPRIDAVVPSGPRPDAGGMYQMSRRSEAAPTADRMVVFESAQRSAATVRGATEPHGCLIPVDPNELMPTGIWDAIVGNVPISYAEYDRLKKQGLPRPRRGDR